MYDTQSPVTGGDIFHNQPDTAQVHQHLERFSLAGHLVINGIDMLRPAGNASLDAFSFQFFLQTVYYILNLVFAVSPAIGEFLRNFLVLFGGDITKRQVFQLPLDLPDTEPVSQRGKDIQCFLSNPLLIFFA